MRRTVFILMTMLLALVFYSPAHAAPGKNTSAEKKEPIVLMPLKVEAVDKSMVSAMEGAIAEGLQDRYRVYFGENVAKKAREIFNRESRKKECDETMCLQDIGIAFQSELIASALVTKRSDGYFLTLKVLNITDNTLVFSKSLPCKGCDEYQVVDALKTLAGGGQKGSSTGGGKASAPSAPVASPVVPSGDFSLDELDGQAKAEEERKAAEKAKWDKYLAEMKKAFGQVEGYEKRDISKDLKVSAWDKFLKTYKDDDPYSGEDEVLREKAKVRMEGIKNHSDTTGDIEMVYIKGGCFDMGDTFGDSGWFSSEEKPVHNVCVDDFYMGKYEVTQRQWMDVMGSNPSDFKNCDDCPVESVSWNDVQEYINRLRQKTGDNKYRLPTEAEWEYAARSGGKKERFAGTSSESDLGEYAWYEGNSGKKPHPVGQKRPNGLGLYDMSGNVWEWVSDWYGGNYYGNSPKDNPKGPSSGSYRVFRGGSWFNGAGFARSANRNRVTPDSRSYYLGFRLVRTR